MIPLALASGILFYLGASTLAVLIMFRLIRGE